jgi:hypothetical protein
VSRSTWMPRHLRLALRTLSVAWLMLPAMVLALLSGCGGGDDSDDRCAELERMVAEGRVPAQPSKDLQAELRACGIRWGQQ